MMGDSLRFNALVVCIAVQALDQNPLYDRGTSTTPADWAALVRWTARHPRASSRRRSRCCATSTTAARPARIPRPATARHPDPAPRRVPAPRLRARSRARAAAARRLRRRHDLPAPGPAGAAALRGALRADHRRGGPPRPRLARRAGADGAIGPLARASAPVIRQLLVGAPRGRPRGLRAQALRHPPARRGRRSSSASTRRPSLHEPRLAHAGLQGPAAREPARRLLPRPRRARLRVGHRARALALLDQHARHLGPRAPVQLPGAQRRDQHRARQRQLAARARAAAALGALRRRPAEALPDRRRALVGLRRARRDARAAGARRPRAGPRRGDADPAGVERADADCRTRCGPSTSTTRPSSSRGTARRRSRTDGRRSPPRSTATACARPAGCARATGWWCSRRRSACSTSTRPTSSSDRLAPGRMLLVDTDAGRVVPDDEIKRVLARRRPYRRWLDEHKLYLDDLPPQPVAPLPPDELAPAAAGLRLHDEELRCWSRRWRATARSRWARWATTRRWRPSPSARSCCRRTSSSSSPRSRTRRSTRSARSS